MKKKNYFCALYIFILCCACFFGCGNTQETFSKSGFYFDTVITVTLYGKDSEPLLEECFKIADACEQSFSATRNGSDIWNINHAAGRPAQVQKETIDLIEKGLYYSEISQGGFDITIGTLTSLWDFKSEDGVIPDEDSLQKALSSIGYENVEISGDSVTLKNPDARIDLGGIAKGYIADKMKSYLISQGIGEGIINLGGNVLCIGERKNHKPYRIGVQKPFAPEGNALFALGITDQTVVTSGVYERYFTCGDKLYHHILDPSTGYPYDNGLSSVTIICQDSADGDGLSTTCFALGLEKGMELIESLPGTEAVFVTEDNELHFSSGMGSAVPYEILD